MVDLTFCTSGAYAPLVQKYERIIVEPCGTTRPVLKHTQGRRAQSAAWWVGASREEQPTPEGVVDQAGTVAEVQFLVDVEAVGFDRVDAQGEPLGDFAVG